MNGVDLHLFQFERDLTWMAFFMDAADGIYTRYGGREDSHPESHLNKESLVRVMQHVLDWHKGKKVKTVQPKAAADSPRTPEEIPTMKAMMASRKENKCIHCHDVKVAALRDRQANGQFNREMVFTYPPPSTVGLVLNPQVQNQVESVRANSPAEKAGLRTGDLLLSLDGQRVFTLADFQAALEPHKQPATVPLELKRGDQTIRTTLTLAGNWRRSPDPSWRESLHVAGPGAGFWGERLKPDEKQKFGFAPADLAVRVTAIFGAHAREAGVKNGDIVVAFDGLRDDMTILQLHAHLQLDREYGATIPLVVRRDGKDQELTLNLPKEPNRGE
jgi:predicted metalloprotease with PDZ domain